jgi:hypothetical protein
MTSLALFLQQCLTEEKYGSTFISEIDQRLETLNYIQLSRMSEVLKNASKVAKMKTWQEGNNEVLAHVEKWLIVRQKEHEIKLKQETEILKRIQHKEKMKQLNEKEKDRVILQLQIKAKKNAEDEIKSLEIQRKASYKEQLYALVEIAEKARNRNLCFGLFFLILGCVLIGLLFTSSTLLLLCLLGGVIGITILIFYRAYRVSQVAPYDENPNILLKKIEQREDELFAESMKLIEQHEREYEEKMSLDQRERRRRRHERRHREELRQYLENHPEIPIDPEEGDVETQIQEYLNKISRQGGEREKDEDGDEKRRKSDVSEEKSSRRIEVIHEERSDEEDGDERKGGEMNPHLLVAPGKDSPLEDEIPETPQRAPSKQEMGLSAGSSSKYLLHEECSGRRRVEVGDDQMDTPLPVKIQLKLLTLSQFLSSFYDIETGEVYLTITMRSSLDTSSPRPPLLLFRTDSQKCLGEVLIWRYEVASSENFITFPLPQEGSVSGDKMIEFALHSSRQSSTTPPLATGLISTQDILSSSSKGRKGAKISRSIELVRSDVIKVCSLSLEYSLPHLSSHPPQTKAESAVTGG